MFNYSAGQEREIVEAVWAAQWVDGESFWVILSAVLFSQNFWNEQFCFLLQLLQLLKLLSTKQICSQLHSFLSDFSVTFLGVQLLRLFLRSPPVPPPSPGTTAWPSAAPAAARSTARWYRCRWVSARRPRPMPSCHKAVGKTTSNELFLATRSFCWKADISLDIFFLNLLEPTRFW